VISLLSQTPGVRGNLDVGGNQFASTPQFRVFGQLGQHYDTLEGVLTASPKTNGGQGGNYYSYGAIEEVSIKTVGSEADNPNRGILMNTVVKSGGNTFGGNGSWTYSGQRFQSNNITPELKAAGIQQGAPIDENGRSASVSVAPSFEIVCGSSPTTNIVRWVRRSSICTSLTARQRSISTACRTRPTRSHCRCRRQTG
jgi:hypothetical protein